jgi:hypothetical protein
LGPLYCSGAVRPAQEADSCESLWSAGGGLARSGYHMVRRREEGGPRVVYCDLSRLPGEPGFERSFGSPGNLRDFVAFDAQLTQSIEDNYRYIGSIAVKVTGSILQLLNYDNRIGRYIKLSTNAKITQRFHCCPARSTPAVTHEQMQYTKNFKKSGIKCYGFYFLGKTPSIFIFLFFLR